MWGVCWGGGAPEGTAATEEEQAGEMIRSLLIDFNLSWIFRAVAKTNHSLLKMIYCLGGGGLLVFCCLQTDRILKLNSCPWELPSLSRPPQESRHAHIQRLDGLKILGSPQHNSNFSSTKSVFPHFPSLSLMVLQVSLPPTVWWARLSADSA